MAENNNYVPICSRYWIILHYHLNPCHHCRQSACAPNFSKFPWGVQVCSLKFGSWINSQYNVEYRSAWRHHISEIMRCSVSRTATDSRDTVELGDYQQTVGWEVVNTKSRCSEVLNFTSIRMWNFILLRHFMLQTGVSCISSLHWTNTHGGLWHCLQTRDILWWVIWSSSQGIVLKLS